VDRQVYHHIEFPLCAKELNLSLSSPRKEVLPRNKIARKTFFALNEKKIQTVVCLNRHLYRLSQFLEQVEKKMHYQKNIKIVDFLLVNTH
jgi:hypothetical protein